MYLLAEAFGGMTPLKFVLFMIKKRTRQHTVSPIQQIQTKLIYSLSYILHKYTNHYVTSTIQRTFDSGEEEGGGALASFCICSSFSRVRDLMGMILGLHSSSVRVFFSE